VEGAGSSKFSAGVVSIGESGGDGDEYVVGGLSGELVSGDLSKPSAVDGPSGKALKGGFVAGHIGS